MAGLARPGLPPGGAPSPLSRREGGQKAFDTTHVFLLLYNYMNIQYTLMILVLLSAFALVLNLPFGYMRGGTRKFSFLWFLYIHLPIPFVIAMRLVAGFNYKVIPLVLAASVIGQVIGARIYNFRML